MRLALSNRPGNQNLATGSNAHPFGHGQLVSFEQHETRISSGPLPSPEDLAAYAGSGADKPDRIFKMAEKEQANRHELQQLLMRRETMRSLLAQVFGFLLGAGGLAVSALAVWKDSPRAAGIIAALDITAICSAAYFGRAPRVLASRPEPEPKPKK